ncbi:MAG: ABC transporter permease subunit [Cyanothece sp. SIO1E1]|nr:ABC transporter permease subunit [Cyanothece sp. SIO1E1]
MGAIALSLYASGLFGADRFNPGGLSLLGRFLQASIQPDLSPDFLRLTLAATLTTLAYAVCGTFLSLLLGLLGGVLTAEVWWLSVFPHSGKQQSIGLSIRALLAIPRAIHELIWGLFFVNIFGLDPLVAIMAIAIPYGAIVAKVFAEILDETPRQSLKALINSGTSPLTALLYTLFPQAWLNLIAYACYRFECSIRSATVLGIIGAGGLGYQILLSLQSLRYEQLWTLFYALFVLNGVVDLSSAYLRHRWGSPSRLDLHLHRGGRGEQGSSRLDLHLHGERSGEQGSRGAGEDILPASTAKLEAQANPQNFSGPDPGFLLMAVLISLPGIGFCFHYIGADFSKLWSPRTGQLLGQVVQLSLPPHLTVEQLRQLFNLSLQTLSMSVLAIAIAGLGGILLSFPAAYNFLAAGREESSSGPAQVDWILSWIILLVTRAILLVARSIPAPIWALVVLFVMFPGVLPGAIALGIHNLGILGRLMAEVNENLDQRPLRALKAQGTPASLVFLYGVLPLTLTRFLAYILYRWEVCLRATVIVGLVGAGGLGRLLTEQLSSFDYASVVVTLGCFVILTFSVDWVSARVRRSLR